MFDFNKLARPEASVASLDPLEIFAKTPNLEGAPNDLWKGQADALSKWHEARDSNDNAIILNTGAGKSLVGILIAQSMVNENIGPIIYVCSTIDLVKQTVRECDKLGIAYTERVKGKFTNDLFETGKAFCITTYAAIFTSLSVFRGDKEPAGIIFDDAHVAEGLIRDAFTLSVGKQKHEELYNRLVEIVRPEFDNLDKNAELQFVLDTVGQQMIALCPPATAYRCREQFIDAFKAANYQNNDLKFPVTQLYRNIGQCAVLVSPSSIEITPPFIPTGAFEFLQNNVRRVFLSATLQFETDFVRGFGKLNVNRIEPDNDAGNGERLIILESRLKQDTDKISLSKSLLEKQKLLISVPSYKRAVEWETIAEPPKVDDFSQELNAFRDAEKGAFVLVSRIDGIDLPQNTCRVMMIDGAPYSGSLLSTYQATNLNMSNLFSTKMASKITQLLGRINRGRSDYGAFILLGSDINKWIKTERNVALLPRLIRKQVILGNTVQEGMNEGSEKEAASIVEQVILRDPAWLNFYRETIDGLEVSEDALMKVREREAQLAKSAYAECVFMTKMWQADVEGARQVLLDALDDTAMADAKLAGWYSLWLGMTYEMENDLETGIAHYKKSRARLSSWLHVPFKGENDLIVQEAGANTVLQRTLLSENQHGAQALSNLVAKLRKQTSILRNNDATSNMHEEALRMYGEILGFSASRPDNEFGAGPDVVWYDPQENNGIAFELKTKKNVLAEYNKYEIGQGLNHIEWLSENMDGQSFKGLIIVGPEGVCKDEANPSDEMFFAETASVASLLDELAAKIADTRGRTSLERWGTLKEIGELVEWQIEGWVQKLSSKLIKSMKVN